MVTLAQAKLNTQDKIVAGVIDEFRKSSFLLDSMIFDDAVAPSGNGATLTYGYTRLITQPTASFRAYNSEYTPQEVTKQRYSVDLKPFGGTFQIDRVLANVGGLVDEVNLQISQKIKATNALFNDALINGDSAVDANSFDGLNKAITGSSTEYNDSAFIDISDEANMNSNKNRLIDMLDEFLSGLDGEPTFIAGNSKLINKIKAIARGWGILHNLKMLLVK
jgi:hypothetical protein